MKKIVILAMGLVLSSTALAQDKVETNVAADFVNEYIWRGQKCGDVAVQPTLGVGYKGLSLTAWGSYGLSNKDDVKEFDLTLAYSTGGLNIGITDYWFSEGLDPDARYFKYDAHGTNHLFEANIGYDFGPVALQWYTNFAGNDGTNNSGKRAYKQLLRGQRPVPARHGRLDSHGRSRTVRHHIIRHDRVCCDQPVSSSDEGDTGDRFVLHPNLRAVDGQPLLTEGIPGSRLYAATLIFARFPSLPLDDGGEGLCLNDV